MINWFLDKIYSLIILSLLFISYSAFGAELSICVKYPKKTPAKGIKVQQVQLERPDPRNYLLGVTDENGEIKVRFEEKPNNESRYGYGLYRYVIMPENYRWEISDLFYWNKEPWSEEVLHETNIFECELYKKYMSKSNSNWAIGKLAEVGKDSQLTWEVTLNRGRNVEVTVVDQFNDPVRNKEISVSLDLEALSHTGWGAEVPIFDVKTDNKGHFNLPNVGMFFYSFELQDPRYCAPDVSFWTRITRNKFDQDKGGLIYHKCIGENIKIVVNDKQTGKPIPKASIIQVKSFSSASQGGPIGYTDINGEYMSENFYAEYMVEFGVFKEGYNPYMLPAEQFVPGKIYKISLQPIRNEK